MNKCCYEAFLRHERQISAKQGKTYKSSTIYEKTNPQIIVNLNKLGVEKKILHCLFYYLK